MKKLLSIFLLVTFLSGYLEWGKGQHLFIWQAEVEIFLKARHNLLSVLHPMTLLPLIGQLMLLITLFQKKPGRYLTLAALTCLSIFMLLLFVVGLLILNTSIIASTLPFIITGIFVLKYNRKQKQAG